MKIASTELAADNCKDQEKICGRIIHNTKCVGSNMILSSGTESDQSKLSEKVTSVKYETVNPGTTNNEDLKNPIKMVRKEILKGVPKGSVV